MNNQPEQNAVIRLVLLALTERLPGIPQADLLDLAQESLFFHYFDVADACSSLVSSKLLILSEQKNENARDASGRIVKRTFLSDEGAAVLNSLRHMLPPALAPILEKLEKNETEKENCKASYQPDGDYHYLVELEANEKGRELIHIRLSVPDEERARRYCQKWHEFSERIYLGLLENLDQ